MPKIIRSNSFYIDNDNVVRIKILEQPETPLSEEPDEKEPEKISEEQYLEQAMAKAELIIERANKKSEEIIREANQTYDHILAEAKQKGSDEGYREGYELGASEAEALKRNATELYDQTVRERSEILESIEPTVVSLITDIIQKLLPKIAKVNPDVILILIKQGLASATITGAINIHVSTEDYDTVFAHKDEILAMLDTSAELEILKDLSLNKSDCIIETSLGSIDCSLDSQFSALKDDLYYILENG